MLDFTFIQMALNIGTNLCSILDKEKLTRAKFIDQNHYLRIVLVHEKKEYVLETPYLNEPTKSASDVDRSAYEKHMNDLRMLVAICFTPCPLNFRNNMMWIPTL